MACIQGFVCAVPALNRAAFTDHARQAAEAFRDYGLISARECWGDDVPEGQVTSFPMAVKAGADETVVFAWYLWPSKEVMDEAMGKVMDDPRISPQTNPMPFDGKRVIFGTFDPIVEIGEQRPGGYFDGFLVPVPRNGRDAFRAFAGACDSVFAEYGANWIMDAWGVDVPEGKVTDLRRAVQATPDEEVVFGWVQWPDKAARDEGSRRMSSDQRISGMKMPFDGKRLVYGGFVPVVEL